MVQQNTKMTLKKKLAILILLAASPAGLLACWHLVSLALHGPLRNASKIRIGDELPRVIEIMGEDFREYGKLEDLPDDGWEYRNYNQCTHYVAGVNYGLVFSGYVDRDELPEVRGKALWFDMGFPATAAFIFYLEEGKVTGIYWAGT